MTLRHVDSIARQLDAYDPATVDEPEEVNERSIVGWFWRLIGKR